MNVKHDYNMENHTDPNRSAVVQLREMLKKVDQDGASIISVNIGSYLLLLGQAILEMDKNGSND